MNIETYTGKYLDYSDPKPEQINISDIAHALSNICRFGGHSRQFYSVAEHALLVRELVIEEGYPYLGLAALHHDSHEAYIGDVPTPLKHHLGSSYSRLRVKIDAAIGEWLDEPLHHFHHHAVEYADERALRIEAGVLKLSRGVGEHWGYDCPMVRKDFMEYWDGMTREDVERAFIAAHNDELDAALVRKRAAVQKEAS